MERQTSVESRRIRSQGSQTRFADFFLAAKAETVISGRPSLDNVSGKIMSSYKKELHHIPGYEIGVIVLYKSQTSLVWELLFQGPRVKPKMDPALEGEKMTLDVDMVLVSTGRLRYTKGPGIEELGVKLDKVIRVEVDDHFRKHLLKFMLLVM
ncbi:hypothetical protein KI387_028204 [Taxus chinensis]|uniref:Uncharacterized protein n=1 Tax=Taxus chinensis TaxID=29808 RepID=A0AA38G196_TAXCH|nr:hypothetical protein KI387_028204 [Taxus chinensis]